MFGWALVGGVPAPDETDLPPATTRPPPRSAGFPAIRSATPIPNLLGDQRLARSAPPRCYTSYAERPRKVRAGNDACRQAKPRATPPSPPAHRAQLPATGAVGISCRPAGVKPCRRIQPGPPIHPCRKTPCPLSWPAVIMLSSRRCQAPPNRRTRSVGMCLMRHQRQ